MAVSSSGSVLMSLCLIHGVSVEQLCDLHWVAVVLFEQQQVVHVLGFLLPVNSSLFSSSTASQES